MKKLILSTALLAAICTAGQAQEKNDYYVKHVEFPQGATLEQKVDMAARLVPTPQQLEWQQMELTAFLHFGINTFTGREWGDGKENPALFNPTDFDAEQWIRSLKEAGFKMAILTAKHHDGFCLWPTKTTGHSVAASPWKDGKGDVVRELRDACDKYGIKFGVYLSPWDRNASCYGDSPKYNEFFIEQLTELLTNYGEVHEVWFDGANGEGPNGKKQEYDWTAILSTIRRLQPRAVTAIMGDDVRWVGNERGLGRETEWSATVLTPGTYARCEEQNKALGVKATSKDLGGRDMLVNAKELFWYPSEVDVSIRPGWFYHQQEDNQVKSLKHLTDIYFKSVGYNSVLLLNIPPDQRGRISDADVNRLKEFADYRKEIFADNRVKGGLKAWTARPGDTRVYQLKPKSEINVVMLREDISKGQRMEAFTVEALTADGWKEIAKGTTVGYKRLIRIPAVEARQLRVKVDACRLAANISEVAAYYARPLEESAAKENWNDLPRTAWKQVTAAPLVIDLGKAVDMTGFVYAPANAEAKPTMAFRYKFYISTNGRDWKEVPTTGEFSNIMHNPVPQTVSFGNKVSARYIKLDATTPDATPARVDLKEIGIRLQK
ncbi:alpha-L-fucosidase [Bacteroides fragilis]|uniref:alpha-L-fucosidase n=1 Tax=Bacteroides fragilis TaxID=817 RepID=UPI000448759C|nr:alpha-L-fucosidase [Bacteroides fragilis]EXZ99444.1 alpha-1,3/4-fucosidase domain protein [Bacteroides fragilis str. S23 R14]EYA65650.1 alpha-1,3/4-fucosidase domain protein [Bacteroides fragilis str. S23L24]EYE43640.1 alpha-1,3/4-fucosidase domain protein [Bacteroides fragilis str. S23L17]MBG9213354.1 alpha-L-fucosidase [Bacteroides fragilis]MBG9224252.1 alpha-L-fucosidase [Bacteroides fragilis]